MTSKKSPSISAILLCYNDERSIISLVINADKTLKRLTRNYEVIVVNDGSVDDSKNILTNLMKGKNQFKLVNNPKNLGYGGAVRTGFRHAKKDLVFYTDGDGQYDVREIIHLVPLMDDGTNFVNGMKIHRNDSEFRVVAGNLYNMIVRWMFWLPINDTDCDFRLIRRSLLTKLDLKSNEGDICVELVKKAQRSGGKFRQVSIHHHERQYGKSQFLKPMKLYKTTIGLAKLWVDLMIISRLSSNKMTSSKQGRINKPKYHKKRYQKSRLLVG